MCRWGTWNIRDAYGSVRGMHRRNFQHSLDRLLDGIHKAVGGIHTFFMDSVKSEHSGCCVPNLSLPLSCADS